MFWGDYIFYLFQWHKVYSCWWQSLKSEMKARMATLGTISTETNKYPPEFNEREREKERINHSNNRQLLESIIYSIALQQQPFLVFHYCPTTNTSRMKRPTSQINFPDTLQKLGFVVNRHKQCLLAINIMLHSTFN